jgi:RIO kinase 2
VFDWPQAVPTDHENADEFLERDVRNLVSYFRRKHPKQVGDPDVRAISEALRNDEFESIRDNR